MDQYSDNNFKALEVIKSANTVFADLINKTANHNEIKLLDNQLFADTENREFPVDSPADTFVSAIYFIGSGNTNKKLASTLKDAIAFHDITDNVKQACEIIQSQLPASVKTANTESQITEKFAYVNEGIGYLPINNLTEIEDAAQKLEAAKDKIPYSTYIKSARSLVAELNGYSESQKLHARIDPAIKHAGELMLIDGQKVLNLLDDRFEKTANTNYTEIKKTILDNNWSDNQEYLMECQHLICNEDIKSGLASGYLKEGSFKVSNPYLDVNSDLSVKEATEFLDKNLKIANVYIPASKFDNSKLLEKIDAFLCNKSISEKFAAILNKADTTNMVKSANIAAEIPEEAQIDILKIVSMTE